MAGARGPPRRAFPPPTPPPRIRDAALTSGTTGSPKARCTHRILAGYLLTFSLFFNIRFTAASRVLDALDWAWVGGLLDTVLPAGLRRRAARRRASSRSGRSR
jgi:acyl-coenzyme A synthetase/AMP-(fatty) acid ligase